MDMETVLKTKAEPVSEYLSDKERVLLMIQDMPNSISLKEIRYELYVLAAVDEGLNDIDAGRVVSHEEAGKLLSKWLIK
jgi:predicted transcriptional regulator